MMKFDIASIPSKESLEAGAVDGGNNSEPISAGAHLQIYGDVLTSVCKSLARALSAKGLDKNSMIEKMTDLINLFKKNGDVSEGLAKYMVERDFTDFEYEVKSNLRAMVCNDPWDAWWIVFNGSRSGIGATAEWSDEYQKKMNDREKALIDKLNEARKAFYSAQDEYDNYVFDHTIITINEVFVKYGEAFSKLDESWYKYVEDQLKYWVKRVEEKRAQKKAEDDTTAGRATPAA